MLKSQKLLKRLFLQSGVVGIKAEGITLKSGIESHWYANARILSEKIVYQEAAAKVIADYIQDIGLSGFDAVVGVPEGARLIGVEIQRQLIRRGVVYDNIADFRAQPKEHGDPKNRYTTNGYMPESVWLYEDVSTTGESSLKYAQMLEAMGVRVRGIISAFDRQNVVDGQTVKERMSGDMGYPYYAILTAEDILQDVVDQLEEERAQAVRWINEEYGKQMVK